ncbi:MAG: septum formation protein Maf [Clostridia bacterium]|nr:septum formation protein Maf [Clostridia bacterium]
MKLILASNSKWRKEILDMARLQYTAISSNVDESLVEYTNPIQYVEKLSKLKAENVASKVEEGIIIASDTIGYMNNEKFEKPKDRKEAFDNMKKLSGNVNYTATGVTIIDLYKNTSVSFVDITEIYLKNMSDDEINWYIDHEESIYDCSGYAIDTCASLFVEKINGDYKSIIGLPIQRIYEELKKLGYTINDFECK